MRGFHGAVAALSLLCATLLSGCAAPWPFPQPTPDPKLPDARQIFRPQEIGPNAGDLATLDPALINFGVDYQVAQLIFPQLVTLDEQQRPIDWAAESHEVSADGLTYTFHLRKGMTWSDGSPIDATTFSYSINRTLDPCTGSDVASYLYNLKGAADFNAGKCPDGAKVSASTLVGQSIVVADPLDLKLTLDAPAGYFLAALSYPTSWAVPKQLIDTYADRWTDHLADKEGFGGNLFTLTSWRHPAATIGSPTPTTQPDGLAHLTFARNERFWGQKPLLKEIQYTLYRDPGTAWAAYKAGDGDVGFPLATELEAARSLKGSTFHQTPQLSFSYVTLDWTRPPFDDIRMRKAVWLALDRQTVAHAAYQGSVQPTIHLLPEGLPGYNPDLVDPIGRKGQEALIPDLATARRLASEYAAEKCGGAFAQCPQIELYFGRDSVSRLVRIAQAVQDSWRSAFPGWSIVPDPNVGLQVKSKTLMVAFTGWGADFPDPSDFISLLWTTHASYNRGSVSIPQVDVLCAQADGMSDLAARIPVYQQAEQLLVEQGAAIPYAQPLSTYVVRSHVVGWRVASTLVTPFSVWQATYLRR
jgi:oligopeptide transport system substrate-binding protein